VDKAFLSNATMIHCGWLAEAPHRKAIAGKMDVDPAMIARLPDLHYLEWHRADRQIRAGNITITGHVQEKIISRDDDKATPERNDDAPRRKRTATDGAAPSKPARRKAA
jgi:hypothetical protein